MTDLWRKTVEVRSLESHCVFWANSADKSGSSKFWIKSRNIKEYENSEEAQFFGELAYLTCKVSICWGGTQAGDPRSPGSRCARLNSSIDVVFYSSLFLIKFNAKIKAEQSKQPLQYWNQPPNFEQESGALPQNFEEFNPYELLSLWHSAKKCLWENIFYFNSKRSKSARNQKYSYI